MNVKIFVKGTTIEIKDDKKNLIDHVMDYNKSQEALNIIQQEAMILSAESVVNDQDNQKTLVQKIIDFFEKIKNAIVRAFSRFINFIRLIFNIIFHKHKIKDIQMSEVSSEIIEKKNERIKSSDYNNSETNQNRDKMINPSSKTNIGVKYLLYDGKTIESVIDIGNIKQYAVFDGIKSVPICNDIDRKLEMIKKLSDTIINRTGEIADNNGSAHKFISVLQDIKHKLFTEANDKNIYENVKLCISNFKNINQLTKITQLGNDIGEKLDKCISELNNGENIDNVNDLKLRQKWISLYSSLVTGYVSSIVRIYIELTRVVEQDMHILGDGANIGLFDRGVSVKRTFDTYTLDLRKVTIDKNNFSDDEYKHLRYLIDEFVKYYKTDNDSTISNKKLNDLYFDFLNIFMRKSNKIKMFTGKINKNSALSMYNFSVGYEGNIIYITCQIVIDNRKQIDVSSIQTLYHTSYTDNLSVLSPTIGNLRGMGNSGDLGDGIITKGDKLRVYASKYPVMKNGFPLSDEGIYEIIRYYIKNPRVRSFINFTKPDDNDSRKILSALLDDQNVYVYEIKTSELKGAKVYADPEHNGVLSKLRTKNIQDNCVYIETNNEIRLIKTDISKFVNFNNVNHKLAQYIKSNAPSSEIYEPANDINI